LRKVAFYPCCATDIAQPLSLLAGLVDEMIFCDMEEHLRYKWEEIVKGLKGSGLPKPAFVCKDVREVVESLPRIDVLFYRGDSQGEGGSGLYVLGQRVLPRILHKFPQQGGLIITDGSNSGHRIFRRMIRPIGYSPCGWGWHMQLTDDQPYLDKHGLYKISVNPTSDAHSNGLNDGR